MLAGPDLNAGEAGLSTAQLRMRQEVEEHLGAAGQSMLDRLLGPGRAVVRVAASSRRARFVSETKIVDPDSQTMISEETQEESGQARAHVGRANDEISRESVRQEREAGDIAR